MDGMSPLELFHHELYRDYVNNPLELIDNAGTMMNATAISFGNLNRPPITNPVSNFSNHAIISCRGSHYDVSYGSLTAYATAEDWAAANVDFVQVADWFKTDPNDDSIDPDTYVVARYSDLRNLFRESLKVKSYSRVVD